MTERVYQLRFDDEFRPAVPEDITPKNFTGFTYPKKELLPRFVREVTASVYVTSPADAAEYLLEHVYTPFEAFEQEEMWVLLLNTKNRITHEVMVYRGTVNTAVVRSAEILREAVRLNAPVLILSHCHPSGVPDPSPEDIRVNRSIHQAAKILDLELLDHVIVGKDRWLSLREKGVGF